MNSFNEDNRMLVFTDNITMDDAGQFINAIELLNAKDDKQDKKVRDFKRKPIKIFIETYGGDVYAMWAIIGAIRSSQAPVYTYCRGSCMSAGLKIYLAGKKRFASEHSTFMFHSVSQWVGGKIEDLRVNQAQLEVLQEWVNDYVSSRTKLTKKELEKMVKSNVEHYFDAKKAYELGIVTDME